MCLRSRERVGRAPKRDERGADDALPGDEDGWLGRRGGSSKRPAAHERAAHRQVVLDTAGSDREHGAAVECAPARGSSASLSRRFACPNMPRAADAETSASAVFAGSFVTSGRAFRRRGAAPSSAGARDARPLPPGRRTSAPPPWTAGRGSSSKRGSEPAEVEPVGVPAGANGRVSADLPVRVELEREAQQLEPARRRAGGHRRRAARARTPPREGRARGRDCRSRVGCRATARTRTRSAGRRPSRPQGRARSSQPQASAPRRAAANRGATPRRAPGRRASRDRRPHAGGCRHANQRRPTR